MVKPEFKPFKINVDRAERFKVFSGKKEFIDFSGAAMTAGYNFIKKEWLVPTASKLVFENNYTRELTNRLKTISGFENVAFTNSGTESCDFALTRFGSPFFALEGAYHGITFITDRVSNGTGYDEKNDIMHLKVPTSKLEVKDSIARNERLIEKAKSKTKNGSLIIELIQSDGGVRTIPREYFQYLEYLRDRFHLKLIVDEVYTGYGRSGYLLLSKEFDVKPDMICLGKGMAAGLPLGAILYNGEWESPNNQVLTMLGGNMLSARVSVEVLNALDEVTLKNVRKSGAEIIKRLRNSKNQHVSDVRGIGFMIGVEFKDNNGTPDTRYAYLIRERLVKKGVVCTLTGENNNVLKVTPPPLIDAETLETGVQRIEDVLNENQKIHSTHSQK
jgi:4-aminobutyrate aminotransferase-like enzyme